MTLALRITHDEYNKLSVEIPKKKITMRSKLQDCLGYDRIDNLKQLNESEI